LKPIIQPFIKRMTFTVALLLCTLWLSGCVPLSVNLQRADQTVSLPLPRDVEPESAIGDSQAALSVPVTLYLISEDYQLFPVSRTIEASEGKSLIEETVRALLALPDRPGASNPFPKGCRLLSIEHSGNTAVVDLSIEARSVESEHQLLWMRSAMAASLIGIEDIEYVNLLIAGRSDGLMSLPSGASGTVSPNLISAAARLSAEHELLEHHDGDSVSIEREAVLYYAARDGRYIVPMVQTVRITSDDFVTPLLEALARAPEGGDDLASPFPQFASALTKPAQVTETESGHKVVRLAFDRNLIASLEREGLTEWQLYAALTYTITGFVPEVDGLTIMLGDGLLMRTERAGKELTFTAGQMRRSDYPDAVGRRVYTYMTSLEGGLVRLPRALDRHSASSPRAVLAELFAGVQPWEKKAARVMPDGVSIDDVLGICISDGEAVINLSSNFYRCCQSLNAQQEQNLIYALVNSLTELSGVTAVRFQVEGETVDHLVSSVFLRGALLRNIGIIK